MTPREHVEQLCKQVNQKTISEIPAKITQVPFTVSSRISYSHEVGPIEAGYHDEYMNDEFDDIIERYHTELGDVFHEAAVSQGLRPKETFEEFMGPRFTVHPKSTRKEIEDLIQWGNEEIQNIEKRTGPKGDLRTMPKELKEGIIAEKKQKIDGYWTKIVAKDYQVSTADKDYAKAYYNKHNEYYDKWIV